MKEFEELERLELEKTTLLIMLGCFPVVLYTLIIIYRLVVILCS